jgi:hypothetical protein
MSTLKEKLISEGGLTDAQADKTIELLTYYLKEKTPSVFHVRIDDMIAGQTLESSFREELNEIGKNVKERAGDLATDLKTAFEKAFKSKEK